MILFLFLFDPSQLINTDTTNRQQAPAVVAYENFVHIFWEDERDTSCDFDIYCRTSTDGGHSFGYETVVNYLHEKNQRNPDGAIYNGALYVVFEDYQHYYDISFSRSTDHGKSFSPSITVNDTTRYSQRSPKITVDRSGKIFVVWYDRYRNKDIYLARSTDNGNSFTPSVLVNSLHSDSFPQYQPAIGTDSEGRVFVAFVDSFTQAIYLARSTDQGNNFDHLIRIDQGKDSALSCPDLAVDNAGRIYVAWEGRRNSDYDIYLARSTNHGESFEPEIRVNDITDRNQRKPKLVVKSDDLYVVWEDYRDNNYDIYIAKSTDHGVSFLRSERVNDYTEKSQRYPDIAAADRLHIAWEDYRATSADIYATGGEVRIGTEDERSLSPTIFAIPVEELSREGEIFDVTGRRLTKVISPGIYFLRIGDGVKKVVVIK